MKRFLLFISTLTLLSFTTQAQSAGDADLPVSSPVRYGNNIISIIPVAFHNNGRAAGICYERFLDERGRISLYVPLTIAAQKLDWHYRDQYKTRTTGGLIGFEFYPTSSHGIVRYAFGLSIGAYDIARSYEQIRSPIGIFDKKETVHYLKAGALVNNSINFTLGGKVSLGLDLNLGVAGSDEPDYDGTEPFVLVMFKAGYRF